ncbi:sugar transferase [Roseisolibacter sp. H3M3-2]|uniref:sugar transferase n=1 Tax=Roseisolibacter sp. H3M3-2 TaxID=3031323 RepID=UPI0023DC3C9E|nr:sugar transferase [Roseisolibacter sp. H3M3-2]MDF1502854.1 sugar transferase [Roseisolibacter sp. H3M3-2]
MLPLQPLPSEGASAPRPPFVDIPSPPRAGEVRRAAPEPAFGWSDDASPWGQSATTGPAVAVAERSEAANRILNVVVAAVALLVLAPLCVLVAALVKLTSSGPVFYTQTRIGLDRRWRGLAPDDGDRRVEDLGGQPFTILKFRSMTVNAESNGQAVWATKHDARVTPIGRVMRKTRIDEIPQLVNVLRGEMNIVGPRPERPSIVVRLRESIAEYPLRHRVKPGITGWAQINHSYDACIEDVRRKVAYDLEYIENQGLLMDLKIMVLTLPVMIFRKGAH